MCYANGSVDQAVSVCPMCKVFPYPRCPHVRDICRNRAVHPRLDVSYLKNAEVNCFNGCGYCKWARTNPPSKHTGVNNPGWPGCCRPPIGNSEVRMISAADWKSVSVVHHIPLPPDVKAMLDSLPSSKSFSALRTTKTSAQPQDRKLGNSTTKLTSPSSKVAVPGTPGKPRAVGGSPKPAASSLSSPVPRSGDSSLQEPRAEKLSHSTNSSPHRKQADLPRRNSSSRVPNTTSSTGRNSSPSSSAKAHVSQSPERRRVVATTSSTHNKPSPPSSRAADSLATSLAHLAIPSKSSKHAKEEVPSSASSSSGSSDNSLGAMSDSTITSDVFTDYLSDESEAELQRQAEARAALVAQCQAEEMEFKSARQQLAQVDLRPPRTWNPTNITNNVTLRRES